VKLVNMGAKSHIANQQLALRLLGEFSDCFSQFGWGVALGGSSLVATGKAKVKDIDLVVFALKKYGADQYALIRNLQVSGFRVLGVVDQYRNGDDKLVYALRHLTWGNVDLIFPGLKFWDRLPNIHVLRSQTRQIEA
jgi:hypothetical protein